MRRRKFLGGIIGLAVGVVSAGCAKQEKFRRYEKGTWLVRGQAKDLVRTTLKDVQHYFPDGLPYGYADNVKL